MTDLLAWRKEFPILESEDVPSSAIPLGLGCRCRLRCTEILRHICRRCVGRTRRPGVEEGWWEMARSAFATECAPRDRSQAGNFAAQMGPKTRDADAKPVSTYYYFVFRFSRAAEQVVDTSWIFLQSNLLLTMSRRGTARVFADCTGPRIPCDFDFGKVSAVESTRRTLSGTIFAGVVFEARSSQ